MQIFRRQFLLTKENIISFDWEKVKINNFTLHFHPELEYTFTKNENHEIHLLGVLYDWETPNLSNLQILNSLATAETLNEFLEMQSKYAGQYVMIYKSKEYFILLNDACGQKEIYYNSDFTAFGTQPKILNEVIKLIPYQDSSAKNFFESKTFLKKCLFVGETTHAVNVKHLLPNHYISIVEKKVRRFFPTIPIITMSIDEAAKKASKLIKGYLKAMAHRDKIAMAVTGGYDSRVLYLASLDIDCKYFVYKHSNMMDNHYDIVIPKKLTQLFGKQFSVIPDVPSNELQYESNYEKSLDFPRYLTQPSKQFKNHIYINGNNSEIARNYYGYHKQLKPSELAFLYGHPEIPFVIKEYKSWMDNSQDLFKKLGYHFLDMFYWEERMGIWAAKARTESNTLGKTVVTPFNSRELLVTLLSTKRIYRDSENNKLYNRLLDYLNPQASNIPINPSRKQNIIHLMKTFKVYKLYRHYGVKYRFLKV